MREPADGSPIRIRFEEWAVEHGFSTRRFSGAIYMDKGTDPKDPTPRSYENGNVCSMWRGYWVGAEMETIASDSRRALAEKILLKLIRISPHFDFEMGKPSYGDGVKMAWDIADAFLKAENT